MAIEMGAKAGLIAPDETTFEYLKGRPHAPKGKDWDDAVAYWKTLKSDDDAKFDTVITLEAKDIAPQVTWGTNPGQVIGIDQPVPNPAEMTDPVTRASAEKALNYIGLEPNTDLKRHSCRSSVYWLLHQCSYRRFTCRSSRDERSQKSR